MIQYILQKILGTKNARELKKMQPMVPIIAALEPQMQAKSDAELAAMTPVFRQRLDNGEPLDDLRHQSLRAKLERETYERQKQLENTFMGTFRNLFGSAKH